VTTELTLRDYVDLMRRRLPVVAACFAATLFAAFLWSALQTPMYRSSVNILINQNTSNDILDPVTGVSSNSADRVATNEVKLLESQLVRREAESRLGFEADISARAESRADFVVVTAIDADALQAQAVAQTYAESYVDVRRDEFSAERLDTAEGLLESIRVIDEEIEAIIEAGGSASDITREQLRRDDLADIYNRLTITAGLGNTGRARIIDDAEIADEPFSPQPTRNMILGGILGLMLGAASALLLEKLDRSLKSRSALEAITPGLQTLAVIPNMKHEDALVSLANPEGTDSEVFRLLRAGIEFASVDKPLQVIQVTSPGAAAGKTTVAANLALVMAQSGQRVAVIDADLRRPRLHTMFKLAQVPGISSVIVGTARASQASHTMDLNNGRLWVFPSGPVPPGPSELLGSKRAATTFDSLRKSLDVIIVDSPPVLPVSDALVLSRLVDATVLVANARLSKRDDVQRALEQLAQADANVIGTVLNEVKARRGGVLGYGGYGYGYGYGGEATKGGWFSRNKNSAPRHEGTETMRRDELPRFQAFRASETKTGAPGMQSEPAVRQPQPPSLPTSNNFKKATAPLKSERAATEAETGDDTGHVETPAIADVSAGRSEEASTTNQSAPRKNAKSSKAATPHKRKAKKRATAAKSSAKAKNKSEMTSASALIAADIAALEAALLETSGNQQAGEASIDGGAGDRPVGDTADGEQAKDITPGEFLLWADEIRFN